MVTETNQLAMSFGPEPLSYAAFCKRHGLTHKDDAFMHINASLRSCPTTKTFHRWNQAEIHRLQAESKDSIRLYREAIERGEICEPEPLTLDEKCQLDPSRPDVQAAIRVRQILIADGKYLKGMH